MADLRTCFVISPIGEPDSEQRIHSDQVLKHIISPALKSVGYSEPSRADKIDESGIITAQIIAHIIQSDLVVADLSFHNPNVFYELSLRHALKKPFVQLIRKGEKIPFDISPNRTIYFDLKDLDSVDSARNQLNSQANSYSGGKGDADNPISLAMDLQVLRSSSKSEDQNTAEIITMISGLSSSLAKIEAQISNIPENIRSLTSYRKRVQHLQREISILKKSGIDRYMDQLPEEETELWEYLHTMSDRLSSVPKAAERFLNDREKAEFTALNAEAVKLVQKLREYFIPF